MLVAKRLLDLSSSLFGLIVLSPVLLAVAIGVCLTAGFPVTFRQQRPGLHGKPFTMIKFRTMTEKRDNDGQLLPEEDRLTRFGRFLRGTSLDELPELINVAKGDMSLVGPRPLLMQYLDRYTPEQSHRHDMRPGITGWAQVNGRNSISWEDKFAYDLHYVTHWSLGLDIKILFLTLKTVLIREGVSATEHSTMPEFMGSTEHEENGSEQ